MLGVDGIDNRLVEIVSLNFFSGVRVMLFSLGLHTLLWVRTPLDYTSQRFCNRS